MKPKKKTRAKKRPGVSTRLEPRKRARPVFSKTKNQMNKRSQRNQGRYLAGIKGSRLERPPKKDKGRCGKAKCAKNGRVVCYTLLYFGPSITGYNKKQTKLLGWKPGWSATPKSKWTGEQGQTWRMVWAPKYIFFIYSYIH